MAGGFKLLRLLFVISSLLLLRLSVDSAAAAMNSADASAWMVPAVRSGCKGAAGECLVGEDEEFELDSESGRRILFFRHNYISYGALQKDNVPCSRRGASYYNCRPGAQANPYSRGCSAITRCRSF